MSHQRLAVAAFAFLALLSSAARAQNDRIDATPTGWWYITGGTSATLDERTAAGFRPFAVEYNAANDYSALYVHNSGAYQAGGGDIVFSSTAGNIRTNAINSGKRVLDLTPETLGTQHSAIVVNNSGSTAATDWDMATGLTAAQLGAWPAAEGLRPIDVEQYGTLSGTRYSIVGVANTGSNFQAGWWWYFGVNESQLRLALVDNDARLIDIDVVSSNPLLFNCIMVSEDNGGFWLRTNVAESEIEGHIAQHGARISCMQRYTDAGGNPKYVLGLIDNANDQTRRVRDYLNNITDAPHGFRVQRVGGNVLAALYDQFPFEPASTIKILHGAYAMDRIAGGLDSLDNQIFIRDTCNNDECPSTSTPCSPAFEPLSEAIRQMLEESDNNRTMEIELRYGRTNLNNFADFYGLTRTQINHTLGCGLPPNTLSCEDACNFYEMIADGTFFDETSRDALFGLMVDATAAQTGSFTQIINEEAVGLGLTTSELADFRQRARWAGKGGSYSSGDGHRWLSEAVWVSLPHRVVFLGTYQHVEREYTVTAFVHNTLDIQAGMVYDIKFEGLREQIREALQTWADTCSTPEINNEPDSLTAFEGTDAQFFVGLAPGAGVRSYQWQRTVGSLWQNLTNSPAQVTGATTPTLTLLDIDETDERQYRCLVSDVCGSDTSIAATLTVNPPQTTCDDIDFNNDGSLFDPQDIEAFLSVYSEGPCVPTNANCQDIDFNNDTSLFDPCDIGSFLTMYSEGPCTPCGQ